MKKKCDKKEEDKLGLSWYVAGSALLLLVLLEFIIGGFSEFGQLFKLFVVAFIAMFVIIQSANYAINAISHYARKTGISDYLIGFLVVSIGTAFPDLSTSIFASVAGKGELILGSVIGACVLNLTFIIGLMAIIGGKIKLQKSIQKTVAIILMLVLFALMLGIDGNYSRIDGALMMSIFIGYVIIMVMKEGKSGKVKKSVKWKEIWKDIIVFGGTLAALLLSARWLVIAATEIAEIMQLPNYFVGIILVATGVATPEIIVSVKSVLQKSTDIGMGNLIGGIIMNIFLVLSLAALINPFSFEVITFLVGAWVILFALTLVLVLTNYKNITRWHGVLLLLLYASFIYAQVRLI